METVVEKFETLDGFKLESLKFKHSQLETIERNWNFFRSWKVRTEIGEFHWNLEALRLDPKSNFSPILLNIPIAMETFQLQLNLPTVGTQLH